jgi:hypothetical protein
MSAVAHGRHARQPAARRAAVKPERSRLKALRSFFWAPAPRGSKQTAASSLLAAPVDVAEEAQEQQRGGEPGPVEQDERLADTSDTIAAIAETTIPEFAGAADRGQMAEPWTSPWDRADIRGLLDARDKDAAAKAAAEGEDAAGPDTEDEPKPTFTAAPADDSQPWYGITEMEMPPVHDRPYVPQAPEVAADEIPPAYLRALEPGKGFFRQHGLSACPLFLGVRDVAGVATAAVKLGSDDDGDWHIIDATVPEWLDDAIAALTQARSALADAIAAADAADAPAEDGTASVLAEVVNGPAEPVTDDTAEYVATEVETAAEVLADTGTEMAETEQTEVARQSEMAAVSGSEGETL